MNDLIKTVLSLSLSGSVLAVLLLVVKAVCRQRLPSVFYYYAWLLVLLRFVIPAPGLLRLEPVELPEQTPSAAVSQPSQVPAASSPLPTHPAPQMMGAGQPEKQNVQPAAVNTLETGRESMPVEREPEAATQKRFRLSLTPGQIIGGVWALGALAWAGYVLFGYQRFSRGLNRTLRRASAKEWQTFRALGGPDRLRLCRSEAVQTPMQLGVVDARLVLPNRSYTDDMLMNILRHELTHFSRHDITYKWFTTLVCAVHWFNPLMWIVRREIDRQCELSCDEKLLRSMTPQQKQSYGQTLLELACDRAPSRAVVATSFATEKRNLKERLEQIMTYKNKGWTAVVLALCVLLILAGCGAAAGPAGGNQTVPPETTAPTEPVQLSTEPNAVTSPAAEDGVVEVSNVDEFLAAIAPNTTIVLKEGEYNLATAANYPEFDMNSMNTYLDIVDGGSDYYYWYNLFDGYALYINWVQNLTIQAAEGAKVTILAEPRYADVIRFVNSDTVTVKNLIAGHTEEPSECAGAVLTFEGTDNIRVEGCELFGCGTLGVMAWNCQNLLATNCKIYDCSLGAVKVDNSYNVQVDGCDIYECRGYEGILSATHSEEVALTNSTIHDNVVSFLVKEENGSKGVYLGGLTVENNSFTDGLYTAQHKPVTFESCEIASSNQIPGDFAATYEYSAYTVSMTAVDRSGKELTDDAIRAMTQAAVTWTAQERYVPVSPEAGEDGMVHVSTVDELVAAIAPNTTIYLEPGEYNLTEASDYGGLGGEYYTWGEEFDGFSLVLKGVKALSIVSDGPDKTSIVTRPRYADVLRLEDCSGVTLKGFTAGHTEEQGSCTGDVIALESSGDLLIEDCSLFGCGVHGINASGCTELQVKDTEIHHCEYEAATLYDCYSVSFINCNIHHNGSNQVVHSGGDNITVNSQRVPDMDS